MYLNPDQYARAFKIIKQTSLSHSTCKLVIYASCLSIDALCAAKILSMLFKKQLIPFQLIPVVGYSDLKSHYDKLDDDIANIILVGCGAMVDIESLFDINADEFIEEEEQEEVDSEELEGQRSRGRSSNKPKIKLRRRIYVIDGHRPWNLDNVFGSHLVSCFDDGYIDEELKQEKAAYQQLLELQQQEDDSDEEDDQEDGDNDEQDGRKEAVPRAPRVHDLDSDNDNDTENDDGEDGVIENFEETRQSKKRKKDELISECEEVLEKYYSQGTTIITSATGQIYAMISSLNDNEANLDTLWLSIIGTTSLDYSYPQVYKKLYPLLRDEVTRMNAFAGGGSGGINGGGGGNSSSRRLNGDASYIAIDRDYYLFLLRHWSLYNSFLYSNYVNSKLLLWQEEGRKKLNKMFAKMGISLQVANQNWLYMDIDIKKKLNSIFKKYLGLYDLEDLMREGFVRHFGYKGSISASEFVESLVALLQHDREDIPDGFGNGNGYGKGNNGNDGDKENQEAAEAAAGEAEDNLLNENEQAAITRKLVQKEKRWVSNFWNSWDALSTEKISTSKRDPSKKISGIDLINKGLDIAKDYQQVIFKTGVMIMEKKMIKNLRVFRLIVLKDEFIANLAFYRNPLNLTRLGQWVLESLAELEYQPLLPLVLAALDSETDTYLVVGLAPLYPRDSHNNHNNNSYNQDPHHQRKKAKRSKNGGEPTADDGLLMNKTLLNTFSVAFQQVAGTTGAKVRIDSFESSVIEIRKDDLTPFLEKLTLCGLV